MKELLAQKGFCWPSPGWPEHALQRGASFATAGGTASPTYDSLESVQRGFVLLAWEHLVVLVLPPLASPQPAEASQSAEFR